MLWQSKTVDNGDIGRVAVIRLSRASFKPGAPESWFHDHKKIGWYDYGFDDS